MRQARGIERMQSPGPSPRRRERRVRGVVAGYDFENTVRVVRVRGAPHAFLPPAPHVNSLRVAFLGVISRRIYC